MYRDNAVPSVPVAVMLRKLIRSVDYSRPVNTELGIRLVNIDGVQGKIQELEQMGESVLEYKSYIPDLLLKQIDDLKRACRHTTDECKLALIDKLLQNTRDFLWPSKN